ncbi:MAG TPA: FMN-binding protein [Candidatus Saccharimonadales bacterium]|nr:FMN-binding protein [Candidatus Saccharimonadales bacterium]
MKKFVIGIFILGVLVIYSVHIRQEQPKISAPSSLTTSNSPTATTSGSGTPPANNSSGSSATAPGGTSGTQGASGYKNGSYTGSVADAYYGNVQVRATISSGQITSVTFLQYPHTHSTSVYINQQAMPYLQQEAIKAQGSNVNIVSGATYTSQAFIQSLGSALSQAA